MRSSFAAILLFAQLSLAQSFQPAAPGYIFQFPRDHFSHPDYQTEWWYYTGNLRSPDGHRFGFELTFFRVGVLPAPTDLASSSAAWRPDQIHLAHVALSDIDGHSFYHTERLNRSGPGLAGESLPEASFWNGNWRVRWTALPNAADQQLEVVTDEFSLRLALSPRKVPVINGLNGVSRKGPSPEQASHYISFTRIAARGNLVRSGRDTSLEGVAWMDHEFFTEPENSDLTGWDWFAIQLNNNEELMLYRLRNQTSSLDPFSSGTFVDAQGRSHFLSVGDFTLTPGEVWKSPHSGASYPIRWEISVPRLQLKLSARTPLDDQELCSSGGVSPSYWEGAMTYSGILRGREVTGVGYLEMTGYSHSIRLSGIAPK